MAVDDIDFSGGDRTVILEISGSPSLNPVVDILTSAGTPNGVIVEISAGSLNAPVDMITNKWLIKDIKTPDSFAS